ncbi:MAG: hypothetical protein ACXVW7_05800, partial [Trebonia sp.]
ELERGSIEVAGVRRTYCVARAPRVPGQPPGAPLLIVLDGSGMDGRAIARWTGLAKRGPAAGVTTVFPDGWEGLWHPFRAPDRETRLDDGRFLNELGSHLEGRARPGRGRSSSPGCRTERGSPSTWPGTACCRSPGCSWSPGPGSRPAAGSRRWRCSARPWT